jgi:protein-S-isoprenylcysteine O-methyltransferase Ste14
MDSIAEASRYLIPGLWAVWIVGWLAVAWNVKRNQWREPRRIAVWNRVPVLLGIAVLILPHLVPAALNRRFFPAPFVGLVLVVAGLLFAAWARWHLGRNWSGEVTVKIGHTLIQSGPYRLVRHPIYSGIVLALVGTALATGAARGFIATVLIFIGFIVKLQIEEARMRDTFPEYADYCRHTARLIPGLF